MKRGSFPDFARERSFEEGRVSFLITITRSKQVTNLSYAVRQSLRMRYPRHLFYGSFALFLLLFSSFIDFCNTTTRFGFQRHGDFINEYFHETGSGPVSFHQSKENKSSSFIGGVGPRTLLNVPHATETSHPRHQRKTTQPRRRMGFSRRLRVFH